MAEQRNKPFMGNRKETPQWDWWGENPAEIVLVAFILVLFFFIHSLPPQGWGIDDNPSAAAPTVEQGVAE